MWGTENKYIGRSSDFIGRDANEWGELSIQMWTRRNNIIVLTFNKYSVHRHAIIDQDFVQNECQRHVFLNFFYFFPYYYNNAYTLIFWKFHVILKLMSIILYLIISDWWVFNDIMWHFSLSHRKMWNTICNKIQKEAVAGLKWFVNFSTYSVKRIVLL